MRSQYYPHHVEGLFQQRCGLLFGEGTPQHTQRQRRVSEIAVCQSEFPNLVPPLFELFEVSSGMNQGLILGPTDTLGIVDR